MRGLHSAPSRRMAGRSRKTLLFTLVTVSAMAAAILAGFTTFASGFASAATEDLAACPTLQQGDTGDCVSTLQTALNDNGANLDVDGEFGPLTEDAVIAFQNDKGLEADGVVGSQTKEALGAGGGNGGDEGDGGGDDGDGGGNDGGDPPATGDSFVDVAGPNAKASQEEFGVPASVTVAQAILESGRGESKLSTQAKNFFGIKCANGSPGPIATGCVDFPTRECGNGGCSTVTQSFRSYASMEDSFRDHGRLLKENKRFANAFNFTNDPKQFAREIHKAGYATDPNYSNLLIQLIDQNNLEQFDK
jgi:peptidoglycan hydrolase-like protein with peptidoglycan-binding domain